MKVVVLLFAQPSELIGQSQLTVELKPPCTVASLRSTLRTECPALEATLDLSRFAVGGEFVADDHVITPVDEVALVPPVSGG